MRSSFVAALAALLLLPSCGGDDEAVVTETRRVTLRDVVPKLNATSDERFRNAQPSPVSAPTPDSWSKLPATEFRLLNYRFGDQGKGEVWVSVSRGGLLENINRWLGQFGLNPIDAITLADWGRVPVGTSMEGVWVEAQGTYSPGMGKSPREEHALSGVIVEADGGVLTVKMIGPIDEVEAQKTVLKQFSRSVVWDPK